MSAGEDHAQTGRVDDTLPHYSMVRGQDRRPEKAATGDGENKLATDKSGR